MTDLGKHDDDAVKEQLWRLATAVRDACYSAGLAAYQDASVDGLCHEGAWECALGAIRSVDFESVVARVTAQRRGLPE